jgi:multidrug transporter EmrE-like cation transporter
MNFVLNATANILMKVSAKPRVAAPSSSDGVISVLLGLLFNPALIIGVSCYFLSMLTYIFILKRVNLNIVYPISSSCSMIAIGVISYVVFKEKISLVQVGGYALLIIGIFIIARA